MIVFIGSVFSPYYHFSGRGRPENHVAFNVALYQSTGHVWAMTERGAGQLRQDSTCLQIAGSGISWSGGVLTLEFSETALPWPGQRLLPKRFSGRIRLQPECDPGQPVTLDPDGRHTWWPVAPQARVSLECDLLQDGGWQGEGYHDVNFGAQPLEKDFLGWNWARGRTKDNRTLILYDAQARSGAQTTLGLTFAPGAEAKTFVPPPSAQLPRGIWGVKGGISCDIGSSPKRNRWLEDTPFYTRSLVETVLDGDTVTMVHETLDCRRLANPFVRLMLPFRMPRQIF